VKMATVGGGVEGSDLTESRHGDAPPRNVGSGGRRLTAGSADDRNRVITSVRNAVFTFVTH